ELRGTGGAGDGAPPGHLRHRPRGDGPAQLQLDDEHRPAHQRRAAESPREKGRPGRPTPAAGAAPGAPRAGPPGPGPCDAPCSSWTYLLPRSSDATPAIRQAAIAKSNAMARPCWNDAEISDGKKVWPVR